MNDNLDREQDILLKMQNIRLHIDEQWLLPNPPHSFDELVSFKNLLNQINFLSKTSDKGFLAYEREFVKKGRFWFRLTFYTAAFWFLLAKIILVPALPSLLLTFFITLILMWIQLAEERKKWDKEHRSDLNSINRDQFELGRLGLIKTEVEKKLQIKELTLEVIEDWLEDYQLWLRHENERRALEELTKELDDIRNQRGIL